MKVWLNRDSPRPLGVRSSPFPLLSLMLAGLPVHSPTSSHPSPASPLPDRLAALKALQIDGGVVVHVQRDDSPAFIASDERVHDNLPPRTVVKLVLTPSARSTVHVEIWLPDMADWNGRFLGLGNGGSAGRIHAEAFLWPLANGYACASTDMGTAPDADSGVGNPEVWKDFGFRATHLMTVAAKQVVAACYGKPSAFSYFNGGSTGGQQALQEAQRHPEDYDGIIAAIPAHCRTPLHAYFLWNDQILNLCPFTESQDAAVIAAGNDHLAVRETPPVAGRFVSDPRPAPDDIEAVIALALQKDPSLTPAHADALSKLLDGPRHAVTGERIFNGVPFGSSLNAARGHLYLFKWVFGADKHTGDLNFGSDIDAYTAALGPYLNAENPDLAAYARRGGKLIMTSGSADSVVPYHASLDYYERVIAHRGGLEETQSFFRFYLIPGMAHSGGPGINQPPALLDVLKAWREQNSVPGMLTGKRVVDGKTELEMPLFPYPSKTGWDAATSSFTRIDGPRGGVERIAHAFRPAAAE